MWAHVAQVGGVGREHHARGSEGFRGVDGVGRLDDAGMGNGLEGLVRQLELEARTAAALARIPRVCAIVIIWRSEFERTCLFSYG